MPCDDVTLDPSSKLMSDIITSHYTIYQFIHFINLYCKCNLIFKSYNK